MNRTFIRAEQGSGARRGRENPEQLNIGVTGLGWNVGTTFVASSLAFYFADKGNSVTFCQCLTPSRCNGLLYDSVAMEQRFACRQFHDVYRLIFEEKTARGTKNMEKGVNWLLPTPWVCENGADLDREKRGRLIGSARGEICVFDLACEPQWDSFLMDMDRIVAVVDPMPSKMIRASRRFTMLKNLELSGIPFDWIVNRANDGISRRQVVSYLKNNRPLWLPEISADLFYADEFACRFSWENKEIRSKLCEVFEKISR